jgi:hypothetical protein
MNEEPPTIQPFDIAPIAPIAEEPPPTDLAKEALAELEPAERMPPAYEKGRYLEVVQALQKETLTADEANNLGCAWAWLAHEDGDQEKWLAASEALTKSRELSQAGSAELKRAEKNLARVQAAWTASAANG